MRTATIALFMIFCTPFFCIAAEEKDGVMHYGNDDLKTYKRSVPYSPEKKSPVNLKHSIAEQLKNEVTALCRDDLRNEDKLALSFEEMNHYIYKLNLMDAEADRAAMHPMQRYYLKQLIFSCRKIWTLSKNQKADMMRYQIMLDQVYQKSLQGR